MAKILLLYAHPGQRFSLANQAMMAQARTIENITIVDLYAEYPRHKIDVEKEQARLIEHDVIVFQFPVYWYSTPSLLKEWQDLVLQHGFAFGEHGNALKGKTLMLAVTAGGPEDAYSQEGYQHHPLRSFLLPLEQTAALCKMRFATPYALYGALAGDQPEEIAAHAQGYKELLSLIRDDAYDFDAAETQDVIMSATLPLPAKG
ncbi:MAG: NAD(P)H-dependent oxidoreductase [Pseudomonadota bacterium]